MEPAESDINEAASSGLPTRSTKRLNVNIDAATYEVFKAVCVAKGISIQAVVEEAVTSFLDENKKVANFIREVRGEAS